MTNLSAALGPVLVALGYVAYGFGVRYLQGESFDKGKLARVLAAAFFLAIVVPEAFPNPATSNILDLPVVALTAFTALGLLYAVGKGVDFATNLWDAIQDKLHPYDEGTDLLTRAKAKVSKVKPRQRPVETTR